jgi:hypothetical protein
MSNLLGDEEEFPSNPQLNRLERKLDRLAQHMAIEDWEELNLPPKDRKESSA